MKEIKINGETFTPKYNLRAMFLYEKMSGHSGFETSTTEDNFMLLYSMLKGSKRDTTLTYDEFIDACDENPNLVNELSECIISQAKANESMMEQVEGGKKAKAKKVKAADIIAMLVLKCGIDPRYVMDEMPLYEADIYLSRAYYVGQELREDVRMVTWATAQVNSKKKLRPGDIYKFPWETVREEPAETPDFDKIKQMSESALKWKEEYGKRPKVYFDPRSLPV